MTAERLEPMNIIGCFVSSLEMLGQAVTAVTFSCCLVCGSVPSVLSSVMRKGCSIGLRSEA